MYKIQTQDSVGNDDYRWNGSSSGGDNEIPEHLRISLNVLDDEDLPVEDPNEPPYRVYPSGELASISADEDSGLISMNLSNLEYSPGLGEDDTQTLAYTITSIPNPEIGNLGYLDQNNNFVEVSAGSSLSIDELRLLHFQTAPDGHGITEFTFTVSDGSSGFQNVAVPYVDITSDQISRKLYPAENDYNHQSDGHLLSSRSFHFFWISFGSSGLQWSLYMSCLILMEIL